MITDAFTIGLPSLCQALPLLLRHPRPLLHGLLRLPLLAGLVYCFARVLWLCLYLPVYFLSTLTGFDVLTQETTVSTCAALSLLVCQHLSPRLYQSNLWSICLAATYTRPNAQRLQALPVLYPFSSLIRALLQKIFFALLLVGVVLPLLVVTAPLTVLGGTVALVPAVVLGVLAVGGLVVFGGSTWLWRHAIQPMVVLWNMLEHTVTMVVLVVVLMVLAMALQSWGYGFLELLVLVVQGATTIHFSMLLSQSFMAPLIVRVEEHRMKQWLHQHRSAMVGFGLLPYLCFRRWPLISLALMELLQGATGVLVGRLLASEDGALGGGLLPGLDEGKRASKVVADNAAAGNGKED